MVLGECFTELGFTNSHQGHNALEWTLEGSWEFLIKLIFKINIGIRSLPETGGLVEAAGASSAEVTSLNFSLCRVAVCLQWLVLTYHVLHWKITQVMNSWGSCLFRILQRKHHSLSHCLHDGANPKGSTWLKTNQEIKQKTKLTKQKNPLYHTNPRQQNKPVPSFCFT